MKSLGITMLDRIMYLAQLGLITREERIEFANLTGLAMKPGNEKYYDILRRKLTRKRDALSDDTPYKSNIDEAIQLVSNF